MQHEIVRRLVLTALVAAAAVALGGLQPHAQAPRPQPSSIGREVAVPRHLADGEEFTSVSPICSRTAGGSSTRIGPTQEGGGRPLTKGTGRAARRSVAAAGRRARVQPRFGARRELVRRLPQRAVRDLGRRRRLRRPTCSCSGSASTSLTFDRADTVPTRGAVDETGKPVTLQEAADSRATTGMFGAGYLEMLARQITERAAAHARQDAARRDARARRERDPLRHARRFTKEGLWDTSKVEGLGRLSLLSTGVDSRRR